MQLLPYNDDQGYLVQVCKRTNLQRFTRLKRFFFSNLMYCLVNMFQKSHTAAL